MTDDTDPIRLLDPEGNYHADPRFPLDIDAERARRLYRDMVLPRRVDNEATALQRTGELGLWSSALGQEGAQVGSAHAMRSSDFAFPTYRESTVAWCRGVDPVGLLGLYRGNTHGGWDPRQHGFGLFTIVLGSQVLHAVGYAMGVQRDGTDDAVIAYYGDGAGSEGDVHEAMIFATVEAAPVVFFCQNNGWAISEPLRRQTIVPLAQRAAGYGMPAMRIDGNDALASLAVTRWALEHARSGNGPVFIEAVTYRMGAHTTSDDPTRYRPVGELEHWAALDPIDRMRKYLRHNNYADDEFFAEVDREADALGERIRASVRGAQDPQPLAMFENVYAEPHADTDRDRVRWAAMMAGGAS
jgi:2-oxoisovalerate dehydrogenase E1 component alpha subunit